MWGRLGDVLFQVFVFMALSRTFLFFFGFSLTDWLVSMSEIILKGTFKIISLIETSQSVDGAKWEYPRKTT